MRDAQYITSFVQEYQEVVHAEVYTIYPIYNYSLRYMVLFNLLDGLVTIVNHNQFK